MCAPSSATTSFCQWKSGEVALVPLEELHCEIKQNISLNEWKDSCVRGLEATSTILNATTWGEVMQRGIYALYNITLNVFRFLFKLPVGLEYK